MADDDQFGERLGTLLRNELSDVYPEPGMTDRLRTRSRRNLMVRAGAIAPVAVAAAVGLVVALGAAGTETSGVNDDPRMVSVGYVRTQVTDALDRSTDYIVLAHSTWADNGRMDEWTEPATGRRRIDLYVNGSLASSATETPEAGGGARWFQIDYQNRTWTDDHRSAAELRVPVDSFQDFPAADPMSIREAVANGSLEVMGRETVDGHDTVRLRLKLTADVNRLPVAMELWVDAVTYLPYREKISKSGRFNEGTESVVFSWLKRSPENQKVFDLAAPAGFRDHTGGK
ncbi:MULTISPECIES: hypothetical protein [Micromonospora]|uniref:Uncharacterized protein n=1 Tax=Micromonospora solifontis TaxID=2487138 RepID=A0ABX9WMF3_9ACTN|nr:MULTISPECIES: hypothetical protein [Micromonospora]NES13226.1 hypothetical protein [Micromonospora sp. PPF5-17B]NES34595.1 hypothetical protein [Micromonospora solifontis]NES57041.1 hypothetical protein [Micromonospora sp. PPF5-6]RNM01846.1 hypothetical protein EFE23_00215 [Micromonospora solifontis]